MLWGADYNSEGGGQPGSVFASLTASLHRSIRSCWHASALCCWLTPAPVSPPPHAPGMSLPVAEVVREVGLLVYDEVHYLRDTERGVVWEESIILAPKATRMAFLSATLPNSAEFAGWVAATHGSPVHVVYTEYRPTPLQHYMFPAGEGPGRQQWLPTVYGDESQEGYRVCASCSACMCSTLARGGGQRREHVIHQQIHGTCGLAATALLLWPQELSVL
jgi:hypothetical protein